MPRHTYAHASHTLPIALPQSRSFAQTSMSAAAAAAAAAAASSSSTGVTESEASLFGHRLGSRLAKSLPREQPL
jgi:surfactin synthase thioesterase subunit